MHLCLFVSARAWLSNPFAFSKKYLVREIEGLKAKVAETEGIRREVDTLRMDMNEAMYELNRIKWRLKKLRSEDKSLQEQIDAMGLDVDEVEHNQMLMEMNHHSCCNEET